MHLHSRSFFLSDFGDLKLYLMAYLSGTVDSVEDSLVVDSLARRDGRFAAYLTEGRAFGPHGEDLVLANSVAHYDDALSRELTDKVAHANLEMRRLGYKPYVAPALSSGALSLLALLRGQWHYSSVYDGQVFMGCRNRLTPAGIETEALTLPPALQKRLDETRAKLNAIE